MIKIPLFLLLLAFTQAYGQRSANIFFQESDAVEFAVDKIRKGLINKGFSVTINPQITTSSNNEVNIVLATEENKLWIKSVTDIIPVSTDNLEAEGFSIQ